MPRTPQYETIAEYLLLLLVTEGDIESLDNTDPSKDAARQLINRGNPGEHLHSHWLLYITRLY